MIFDIYPRRRGDHSSYRPVEGSVTALGVLADSLKLTEQRNYALW
jgi:hypothetical protein